MKQAVLYCRVSTARQASEGVSLDAQRQACEELCKRNGWPIAGVFIEEGISGRKAENRPELKIALNRVCELKGVLVFYSLSRLARSLQDTFKIADQIRECGGQLASVTDNIDTTNQSAMGAFFFTLIAALARLESDIISERVKAANDYTVATKGYRTQGEQPFGWKFDAELGERVEVAEEQEIIAEVLGARVGRSLDKTAAYLNEYEVPTPLMVRHGAQSRWNKAMVFLIEKRAKALAD